MGNFDPDALLRKVLAANAIRDQEQITGRPAADDTPGTLARHMAYTAERNALLRQADDTRLRMTMHDYRDHIARLGFRHAHTEPYIAAGQAEQADYYVHPDVAALLVVESFGTTARNSATLAVNVRPHRRGDLAAPGSGGWVCEFDWACDNVDRALSRAGLGRQWGGTQHPIVAVAERVLDGADRSAFVDAVQDASRTATTPVEPLDADDLLNVVAARRNERAAGRGHVAVRTIDVREALALKWHDLHTYGTVLERWVAAPSMSAVLLPRPALHEAAANPADALDTVVGWIGDDRFAAPVEH